jgi:malate dehydrogenase
MVPIRSCCRIGGMPVEKFVGKKDLEDLETRTRKAGAEVVGLLGTGSAFVSPAWAALQMTEAIAYDRRQILPVCALLEGEYGVDGLFVGVPCILGANGVEQVIEVDLTPDEKEALMNSVGAVRKTCAEVDELSK